MKRKGAIKFFFRGLVFAIVCMYILFKIVFIPLNLEKLPLEGESLYVIFPPNPFNKETPTAWSCCYLENYDAKINGVEFRIFVKLKEDGKWHVTEIQTCDPKFVSEEGFSPGKQTDEEIAQKLGIEAHQLSFALSGGWHVVMPGSASKLKRCFNRRNWK